MGLPWVSLGSLMDFPWVSNGSCMGLPRVSYTRYPMELPSNFMGSPCHSHSFPVLAYVTPMILPRVSHGYAMGLLWAFHGLMVFPRVSHGTSKGLQCLPTGFQYDYDGVVMLPWISCATRGTALGLQHSHGTAMGLYYSHKTLMAPPWDSNGSLPWISHYWSPVGLPSDLYGIYCVFSCWAMGRGSPI